MRRRAHAHEGPSCGSVWGLGPARADPPPSPPCGERMRRTTLLREHEEALGPAIVPWGSENKNEGKQQNENKNEK